MDEKGPDIRKQDFATAGTESFTLPSMEGAVPSDKVVINIEEEEPLEGAIMEKGKKKVGAGAWYKRANAWLASKTKVNLQVKATFFHLLSVMVNSGIPVVKALRALGKQEKNVRMKEMVSIPDMPRKGISLIITYMSRLKVFTGWTSELHFKTEMLKCPFHILKKTKRYI